MKTFKPLAAIAVLAAIAMLPSCRKSMDLSEDDLPKTESSSTSDIDPTNAADDVATFTGSYNIAISYSGTSATIAITDTLGNALSAIDSLEITTSGAGVTVNNLGHNSIHYTLSGSSTAGFFKLYSPARQEIELDNLTLTGSNGAAINNQSDKRTYIVLTGSNTIKDGGSYSSTPADEDERAAFFSEGQICVSGSGSLSITASSADGKGGLFSDDYIRFLGGTVTVNASKGHAIRGKDAVIVSDGTVKATSTADGKKAVTTDGIFQQDGGSLTASATGAAVYDSEEKDQDRPTVLKCDGDFVMNGGSLTAEAKGSGGKGIKCSANIKINGGYIFASSASHEGFTCDGTWTQDGGTVIAEAYDDAVNSAGVLTVNDGYLRGTSRNNDGVDANAAINISGGVVIGEGSSQPECGIDSVEGTSVTVNGGYVISRGGGINSFTTSSGKAFVQTTTSSGAKVGLVSGSTQILAYQAPSSGGTTTLFCTPEMTANSSYTIYTGVSSISEQNASFPRFGVNFSGGSSGSSLTASSSAGSSGPGGGGPGGGGPGGGGPGGWGH